MGSIINSLTGGVSGNTGAAGGNFQAGQANVINPLTQQQATDQFGNATTQANNALGQQQSFLNAVQAQNGLSNQSSVYNQLQGVASGTGPNPAQAQLAQATGASTANQAALMAGQRGSGANAGLLARQAAMQGSANQQNSAGQAATLQANQSLNALNSQGALATNQANQQANATNALNSSAQGEQGQLSNAISGQNTANNSAMASQNSSNAAIAGEVAKGQQGLVGGLLNGIGAGIGGANGGMVQKYAAGGQILGGSTPMNQVPASAGPQSMIGKALSANSDAMPSSASPLQQGADSFGQGIGSGISGLFSSESAPQSIAGGADASDLGSMSTMMAAEGGQVPAMVSPGEKYLDKSAVQQVKAGADPMSVGETIPGKAKVSGSKNSYANDTVPKTLESGGIVLPRSVTQSSNPHWAAHKFVSQLMAEGGLVGHPLAKKPKKAAKK